MEVVDFDLDRVSEFGFVDPEAEWIFGESGDHQGSVPLNDVPDARLLSDGSVAVINRSTQEIFLVDPDGAQWQKLGGRGDGPGQFQSVTSVWEQDGGIGIFDGRSRRWTVFQHGEYIGSQQLQSIGPFGAWLPEVVIPDGRGFYVGDALVPSDSPVGETIRQAFLVARVEGNLVDTITILSGGRGLNRMTGALPLPWEPTCAIVKADSGLWLGSGAFPEVTFWSQTGELRRIVRWRSSQDPSLTRRKINAYRDRRIEEVPPELKGRIRENFRNADFPSEIPVWGTLIMGSDGVLWISEYPGPDLRSGMVGNPYPAQVWWGLGPDGRPIGKLTSPAGLQVTGFGSSFIVGIHKDALNVQTVRRYRIANSQGVASSR